MLNYLERALSADNDGDRDAALDEGLVAWDIQFVELLRYAAGQSEAMRPLAERGMERFTDWLGGETLTQRADEDERRALAAVNAATMSPGLSRLAVEALGGLPPEHPLRRTHLDTMLQVLRRRLEELKKSGPTDDVLITFSTLINQEENSDQKDALVEDGLAVLESNPNEEARDFRLAAAGVFVDHAIQERDAGNPTAQHRQAERGRRILSPLLDREAVQRDPYDLALGAMLAEVEEDPSAAFELYERVLGTDVHEGQRVRALLGLLRTGILTSQHESVVHYGSSMLDLVVQRYAVEVDEDEAELAQRAEDLSDAVTHIATSCIALGDLEHLLLTLERASSARLRHRSLLRRGRSSRRIRQLEEALWGVERGAPVDAREAGLAAAEGRAAAALTLRSRLQETYRTAAQQVTERFDPPDPDQVSQRLRADEGIVVLGLGTWGTALLFLRRTEPLVGEVLAQGTLASWAAVFAPNETGWAYVLGAPWEYHRDPRADLDLVLSHADELIGSRIASWARSNRLRRIWIVPHSWLALVPW
jgi:hypothetical protein